MCVREIECVRERERVCVVGSFHKCKISLIGNVILIKERKEGKKCFI